MFIFVAAFFVRHGLLRAELSRPLRGFGHAEARYVPVEFVDERTSRAGPRFFLTTAMYVVAEGAE